MTPPEIKQGCSNNALQYCCSQVALCDTVTHLNSQYGVDELMELVITRAAGAVNAEHGFFYQYDPDADVLELKGALGLFSEHIGYQVEQGVGLTGKVLQSGRPMAVNDYQSWKGRHPDPRWNPIQAITAVPLTFYGQVRGEIGFVHIEAGKEFGDNDMVVLTRFALLANTALNNVTLSVQVQQELDERKRVEEELQRRNDQLQETFIAMVNALALTIEMRDPYTAAHQRWVTRLACTIADKLDLAREQIEGLHMAGLIHDIGKMNVPTELLIKPGQLSEIEYEAVKIHPQSGYDIVRQIQFPWPVAQIVWFVTYQAAWRSNQGLPAEREVAIAKAWVSQASRRVMHSAHQVHGAIGFTEDHILHFYTKKARANEFSFGDVNHHLETLAAL